MQGIVNSRRALGGSFPRQIFATPSVFKEALQHGPSCEAHFHQSQHLGEDALRCDSPRHPQRARTRPYPGLDNTSLATNTLERQASRASSTIKPRPRGLEALSFQRLNCGGVSQGSQARGDYHGSVRDKHLGVPPPSRLKPASNHRFVEQIGPK